MLTEVLLKLLLNLRADLVDVVRFRLGYEDDDEGVPHLLLHDTM